MFGIIQSLKNSGLFTSIDIIELIDEETVKFVKIEAKVIDGSIFYISELNSLGKEKYSYHWQKKDGKLIMRWDNKPHWKNIATFPHHKHIESSTLPSHRITVAEIIEIIRNHLY
ncbi:MAG: hypothetical protein HY738_01565 [Bacteroidia bacterium]|nr:hypothetical protein [Bacteroidia bacterium]